MAVAKSYQNMPQVGEPYVENNRMYVKIDTGKGEKKVRWYSDAEYARMYHEEVNEKPKDWSQKETLGFNKGYITVFKGDTYSHLTWFKNSICRYAKWWGWYLISTEEMPEDVPADLTPIKLYWSEMSDDDRTLTQNENRIKTYVESLLYDESPSKYVGEIGDRLDLTLKVKRTIPLENGYGISTMHTFEDEDGNVFLWTTASKTLCEGLTYSLRGTVKDHSIYRNCKQTILTRCTKIEQVN